MCYKLCYQFVLLGQWCFLYFFQIIFCDSGKAFKPIYIFIYIADMWNLLSKQWITDLIQSFWFVGFLFGVVIFGQASDRFGRHITMLAGFHVLLPVCLLTSFAYNWQIFGVCRLITGFLYGGVSLVQYVYTQEMIGRKWWTTNSLIGSGMFPAGFALLSMSAYLVPNWRNLIRLLSVIQIPLLLCLWFLPESPRWLYSQGYLRQAEAVLVRMAKWNGKRISDVKFVRKSSVTEAAKYTLVDLFRDKIARTRALVMLFLWFVSSFVYYALTLAAGDLSVNLYLSTVLQALVEYPALLCCSAVLNKVWCGRRRALVAEYLMSGIACLVLTGFGAIDKSNAKLAIGLFGKMAIAGSFSTIYLYSPELFPTCIRNVAIGTLSFSARIGGIAASFSKSLISSSHAFSYLVFGIFGITAGVLALILPETLGEKPPDTFEDLSTHAPRNAFHELKSSCPFSWNAKRTFQSEQEEISLVSADEDNVLSAST